jgi:protein SCO1/2
MIQRSFNRRFTFAVCMLILSAYGCDRLKVQDTLSGHEYLLKNQHDADINFPSDFEGKVMLVGYVYTHCPDICPLITFNMRDIQNEFEEEDNLLLVSVSFDPDRDTPDVLLDYASNFRLNQNNWQLLTGNKPVVESLLSKLKIGTVKTPTRFTESGTPIYFIDHTDRVTLIDGKGQIRKHYPGSELDKDEVVKDIRRLLMEG